MYHGPVAQVRPYFEELGFCCPQQKGLADFLQEVTSPKVCTQPFGAVATTLARCFRTHQAEMEQEQHRYWARQQKFHPVTSHKLASIFQRSRLGCLQQQRLNNSPHPLDQLGNVRQCLCTACFNWSSGRFCRRCIFCTPSADFDHLDTDTLLSLSDVQAMWAQDPGLLRTPYALSNLGMFKACWERELILVRRLERCTRHRGRRQEASR